MPLSPLPPPVPRRPPRCRSAPRPAPCPSCGALANATSTLPVKDTATGLLGTSQAKTVKDVTAPAKGLLGGLPTGGLKTGGLSANGLPLGR